MTTLEDDHAELENYPLSNWQPVEIISKCRCYALKLLLPHYRLVNTPIDPKKLQNFVLWWFYVRLGVVDNILKVGQN